MDEDEYVNQHKDDSNILILPSKKRKTGKNTIIKPHKRPKVDEKAEKLTKKEKRRLEALKNKKNIAEEREELFKRLIEINSNIKKEPKPSDTTAVTEEKMKNKPSQNSGWSIPTFQSRVRQNKIELRKNSEENATANISSTKKIVFKNEEEEEDEEFDDSEIDDQDIEEMDQLPKKNDQQPNIKTVDNKSVTEEPKNNINDSKSTTEKKEITSEDVNKEKTYYVLVDRKKEIQDQRLQLPIIMEEQPIMEAIRYNDFVIICGETGSGKTTQVPQFLYEAGYGDKNSPTPGMIGVTEPRRVAAISTAQRVALELNQLPPSLDEDNDKATLSDPNRAVSYQVRYDSTINKYTKIKFMTEGILLREVQSDFILSNYSAIIIDEAHERTINTDLLLGLLCRIVPLRRELYEEKNPKVHSPLKVIIMSATLRVSSFVDNKKMFPIKPPPVINVEARQYPVTIHFNKKTSIDYVRGAYDKVCKIHKRLPQGGILVFLTGQQEIEELCKLLKKRFGAKRERPLPDPEIDIEEDEDDDDDEESEEILDGTGKDDDEESDEIMDETEKNNEEKMDVEDEKKETKDNKNETNHELNKIIPKEMVVLPLYSMLSQKEQLKIFKPQDPNKRLVVVATNIAETSLTIPGITYVVDSGRVKVKEYNKTTGMLTYKVVWASKAAVNQRAGRAGRIGPGHCYRLFSSAVYQDLDEFPTPDILNMPIEGVVLQMNNMGIKRLESFPFPTPPDTESIHSANKVLQCIGALKPSNPKDPSKNEYKITSLGKILVNFPISPRYAKMLVLAIKENTLQQVIAIVSALNVGDPFLHPDSEDKNSKKRKAAWAKFTSKTSDLFALLSAIIAFESSEDPEAFCESHYLHYKSMLEIRMLREQLTNIIRNVDEDSKDLKFNRIIKLPTKEEKLKIRQIIASGFTDQVAKKELLFDENGAPLKNKFQYITLKGKQKCLIHPNSFLKSVSPEYVVYNDLVETTQNYIKGVTAISIGWMAKLAPWMLNGMDQVLETPPPKYDPQSDSIKGTVQPTLVYSDWVLPKMNVPLKGIECYKHFAKCFIEGEIIEEMKIFRPFLKLKPSLITNIWVNDKIAPLIQPLLDNRIDSLKKLKRKWSKEPNFWRNAVASWIDESKHKLLIEKWPPKCK